jgi:hypothetical protein
MAKRHDPKDTQRKNPFLPDPDEYYFDDELDSVTRNLPTEEEYLPQEEQPEPETQPVTEGTNRIGVRMIGLKPMAEDITGDEDDFTPAYDAGDDDDLTAPRRVSRSMPVEEMPEEDEAVAPVTRSKTRKQQRHLQAQEEQKPRSKTLRLLVSIVITFVLLIVIGMMMLSRTMMPDTACLKVP